jgi:hypothetical protein
MNRATVVYSGRMTNWPLIGSGVFAGLALAAFGRPWAGPWPGMVVPLAIFLIVLTVSLLTSTSLRVTAGPRGVQVRCGVFGWPRFTYSRERISGADIVAVSIWHTWNWTPRGGWQFVLRSGPALRLTLSTGRHVTIGVTDAEAALAALDFAAPNTVAH